MSDTSEADKPADAQPEGGADADATAAEWEAMANEPEGADGGDPAATNRILNQNEIDSLLGFDDGAAAEGKDKGVSLIVNSALVSYERLPMLEVIFDRLVRMLSTSLRNFTSDNVEVSIDNITSVRFGDYLDSIPLPAMLAVFRAEEWDDYGLLTVDSSLIYSIVDVLLGGRRGTVPLSIEGRPYTTIERTLVDRLMQVVLADLSAAFDPLSPVTFRFDRLETNPRFASIARPANAAILTRLRVDMEDRGGRMELLLPYATLEPIRELLLQMFVGEKFGHDSIWENHLATELWSTDIDVTAVLDEQTMPLSRVLELEIGSRLMLDSIPNTDVEIRCGDVPMFTGKVGRSRGRKAVQIGAQVPRKKKESR